MFCEVLLCINVFYIFTILQIFQNIPLSDKKALQQKAKGLEMVRLPGQDEFRNFCMSDETEKVCQRLEEVISIC